MQALAANSKEVAEEEAVVAEWIRKEVQLNVTIAKRKVTLLEAVRNLERNDQPTTTMAVRTREEESMIMVAISVKRILNLTGKKTIMLEQTIGMTTITEVMVMTMPSQHNQLLAEVAGTMPIPAASKTVKKQRTKIKLQAEAGATILIHLPKMIIVAGTEWTNRAEDKLRS